MSTAALFTIAKTWNQARCPLTDEWIKFGTNIQCNITRLKKKNQFQSAVVKWMNLESVIQSEEVRKEK